jgi:transposase
VSGCSSYRNFPGLNPIEELFAKLKHHLRTTASRTANAVGDAIGQILDTVTSTECRNYFTEADMNRSNFIPL